MIVEVASIDRNVCTTPDTQANMDDYRLNAESVSHSPSWWLRNSSGVPMVAPVDSGAGSRPPFPYPENKIGGLYCWDHTNPAVREAWAQECINVTSPAGGFDGCMVDRWTRNPFKRQPGYPAAAVAAWKAGMNMSEALLLEKTRAAGVWLVGEGTEVDANSDPGYSQGTRARGGNAADSSIRKQLGLAQRGQGLLASYKPGSIGASFTNTLASFLIGGEIASSAFPSAWFICLASESIHARAQLGRITISGRGPGLATTRLARG